MGCIWMIQNYLPAYSYIFKELRWIAVGCFLIGILIGIIGVIQFVFIKTTVNPHKPENTSEIVKTGVYAISRNPMYLGLLLGLISIVLYWGNIWSILIIPIFVLYMNEYQIKPEENMLRQRFDQEYLKYTRVTNRWFGFKPQKMKN